MIEIDIELTLTVNGPFLSRSSNVGGYGVDVVALRDRDGFPLLPGSQVRGRIRESLLELYPQVAEAFVGSRLGPVVDRGGIGEDVDSANGDLATPHGLRTHPWFFGDFHTRQFQQVSPYDGLLTRIAINEETGTAQEGALLVVECAVPQGETADFDGLVTITAGTQSEAEDVARKLIKAACWVPSFGSFRSVGFGRVAKVAAKIKEIRDWDGTCELSGLTSNLAEFVDGNCVKRVRKISTDSVKQSRTRHLTVEIEEPFCLGGARRDRNIYRSLKHIPGSVLKGAISHQLQRILGLRHREPLDEVKSAGCWQAVREHFDKLRFLAAFAAPETFTDRPVVDPLSLFKGDTEQVHDACRLSGPFLIGKETKPGEFVAPAFCVDWKKSQTDGWISGRLDPAVELRLHTAIESSTRRAKDQHLFGMELVHSVSVDGAAKLNFRGQVSLDPSLSDTQQSEIWAELESLMELAAFRIGKTKARARFRLVDCQATPKLASSCEPVNGQWVMVLQSAALILDSRAIHDLWVQGVDGSQQLYSDFIHEVSGGALKLMNHFSREALHGGFLAYRSNTKEYQPFLVTEPSTVLVVEAVPKRDTDARKCVGEWFDQGLPLPAWAKARHGESYLTNPFLRSDGFGEIAVNIPAQLELAPSAEKVKLL